MTERPQIDTDISDKLMDVFVLNLSPSSLNEFVLVLMFLAVAVNFCCLVGEKQVFIKGRFDSIVN